MSSNKNVKNELIKKYGAECFIEKLHLREDGKSRKYKSKGQRRRMKRLTYHHIKMKKDGGPATKENGALLSSENHMWFHQQSESAQEYMNEMFQKYKKQVDECQVVIVDEINLPFEVKMLTFNINKKGVIEYNRAETKRKTQELIDDYYDENER